MASRILVTGGSGFIGTNVVAALLARGATVLSIDIAPPQDARYAAVFRRTDICDAADLAAAFDGFAPDAVIHLAARTDLLGTTVDDYAANTVGTDNLLAVVAAQPAIERVLFASSMLVCRLGYLPAGPTDYAPDTAYGASKVESERRVRAADPGRRRIVMFPPTAIWGPWFGEPYRNFFDAVIAGLYVHPDGAATRRSYGYVDNAVAQIEALLAAAAAAALDDRFYHLADYSPTDIGAWAEMIAAAAGRRRPLRIPLPVMRGIARAGDALKAPGWARPPMTSFRLSNMMMDAVQDTAPMAELCPVLPVGKAEGVAWMVAWPRGR